MKRNGTVYLTIRRRRNFSSAGDFTVERASTTSQTPKPGAVEIPIKIEIDSAWFNLRAAAAKIEIPDPPAGDVTAGEPLV